MTEWRNGFSIELKHSFFSLRSVDLNDVKMHIKFSIPSPFSLIGIKKKSQWNRRVEKKVEYCYWNEILMVISVLCAAVIHPMDSVFSTTAILPEMTTPITNLLLKLKRTMQQKKGQISYKTSIKPKGKRTNKQTQTKRISTMKKNHSYISQRESELGWIPFYVRYVSMCVCCSRSL